MSFRRKAGRWERNDAYWRIQQRNAQYETLEKLREEQRANQLATVRSRTSTPIPAVTPGYVIPEEVTTNVNGDIDPRNVPLPPEDRDEALMNQALTREGNLEQTFNDNLAEAMEGRSFFNLPWKAQLKNKKQMQLPKMYQWKHNEWRLLEE